VRARCFIAFGFEGIIGKKRFYKDFQIYVLGVCACISKVQVWKENAIMGKDRKMRPTRG
jgi:hypothetical protein